MKSIISAFQLDQNNIFYLIILIIHHAILSVYSNNYTFHEVK